MTVPFRIKLTRGRTPRQADAPQKCPWNDSIAAAYGSRGCAGAGAFGANGDRDLMSAESKEAEYRRYAGSLVDLASRAATIADKFRLLVMAHDWLKLADKMARLTRRRRTSQDPLTRQWLRDRGERARRDLE